MEPKTKKTTWASVVTFDYPSSLTGSGVWSTGHQRAPPHHQQRGDATSRQLLMLRLQLTTTTALPAPPQTPPHDRSNTQLLLRFSRCLYRINATPPPLRDSEKRTSSKLLQQHDHAVAPKVQTTTPT